MFSLNSDYNYPRFSRKILVKDMNAGRKFYGPRPGGRAPDFELRSLTGDLFRLSRFRGVRNVALMFGSATCPMTAGSIHGMDKLAVEFAGDVEFAFIYVREAHPGDEIPAPRSMADKARAAEVLQAEEEVGMNILLDDLSGTVHRKYGKMPNSFYLIGRDGRVAFRALWAQPGVASQALEDLLRAQERRSERTREENEQQTALVLGGEDRSMPLSYPVLYTYRALARGGRSAILDFEAALGFPGKLLMASSRLMGPLAENPGKLALGAALGAGVLAGGLYAGRALRRKRLASRQPYQNYRPSPAEDEVSDYGVVGI